MSNDFFDPINESTQKEGMIATLIKMAKLSTESADEQEYELPVTNDESDYLSPRTENLLLSFLSGIRMPDKTEKLKGFSVRSKQHEGGDVILYLMALAEKQILVTHLNREKYSEMYRTVQQEKIDEGLEFERLVQYDLLYSEGYEWLTEFFDEQGNPIGKYKEYLIATNWQLPFDFMIIDEKYLVLVHRGSPSDDVFVFENDSMVQIFLSIWNNLKSQQDGDGKTASLGIDVTPGQRRRIHKNNPTSRRRRTRRNF
jgi:hypothetical protein